MWVYDTQGTEVTNYLAFESTFTGGVRTAVADLNGDGTPDIITAAGPGGGPRVRAFNGLTGATLADFMAYETTFLGGVWVAAGPVGSGQVGIATGADAGGGPRVRVFSANGTTLQDLFAFDSTFQGGARVALGQKSSGPVVYATPGDGLDPTVRGFDVSNGSQLFERETGPTGTAGGTLIAAGDLDADGVDDIFTAVANEGSEIRVFSGATGMYMNQSWVDSRADGLGVVNWNGQRAVGVLSDGSLQAYAFVSGTQNALLGQQDVSQGGGVGSSLGGTPVGGTAGSLGAGSQKTLTADWLFPVTTVERVTVTSKVTMGLPNYPDKYKWEYHLVNHDFDMEISQTGVGHVALFTPVAKSILEMGNNKGWSQQIGEAGDDTVVKWSGGSVIPWGDGEGDFWFTTPALPIVEGIGDARDGGEANRAGGKALVPDKNDLVADLDIEGLDDAAEEKFPGKKIRVNDNIDELQYPTGIPHNPPATKLEVTADNLPNPNTGQHQLKPDDPDVVNGTLTLSPTDSVGNLSWTIPKSVQVWWKDTTGAWVLVSDRPNFTAQNTSIELKIEGMKPGQSFITARFVKTDVDPWLLRPPARDAVAFTVYTGLKITDTYARDLEYQTEMAGAWTLSRNSSGDEWRTKWVAETDYTNYGYAIAETWQKRAREKLDPIFRSEKQTAVKAVKSKDTIWGTFDTSNIDPSDMAATTSLKEQRLGSALLVHELVEQYQKQVNGVTVFADAHARAREAEAYVYVGSGTREETLLREVGSVKTFRFRYDGPISLEVDLDMAEPINIIAIR